MNKSKKSVIHMDSSGKFLKQGKGKKKRLLNTAIVIPPPAAGHASFPILELISEDNKTIDFKIFLQTGWSLLSKAIGDGEVANPNIAVTDCAFPNIHSLMSVFNQTKLSEYLEGIYRSFMSKQPVLYKTIVTLCINHLLPIMLKTARAVREKVAADTVVAAVLLVLQSKTIEEALTVWQHVVTVFCSKEVNEEVEKARDFIKAKSKGNISEFEDLSHFNYDFEDNTEKSEETEFGNRKLLRVNSPFFKLFKRTVDKAKKAQEQILRTTNSLYAPQCVEQLVKQYLSLFPLLSASLLDGAALYTNSNVELYWQEQRRIVKDIPDRLMWPPRYLGRLLHNVRNETKNMLLHNIVPSLKFGGKLKSGSGIHFGDYIGDNEDLTKKDQNVFNPTPTKSERKKRKVKETFYGCQEDWDSQKKRTPKKTNYLKDKTIDFGSIVAGMALPVEFIRVTGTRRALGKDEGDNTVNLSPMAIQLKADDIRLITNKHEYITTDAVDAGLCLLDRKLNEESSLNVTVYSTQNCRLIVTGVPDLVQDGKFITIIPRNFGLDEEASRLAGSSDGVPGSHFTLVSNLFCGEDEVNIYETYGPLRDAGSLLTPTGKKLIKRLCNSVYDGDITVNCINVAEQEESECGVLSVALAVHLCFYAESENAIYNRIMDVRKTFLDCLKHNSLTYFKMTKRNLDDNQKTVLSLRI